MKQLHLAVLALLFIVPTQAAVTQKDNAVILSGANHELRFDTKTGALESLTQNGKTVLRGGEWGLWQIKMRDGTVVNAKDCAVSLKSDAPNNALTLQYRSATADVAVSVEATTNGADFRAIINAKKSDVLDFSLPARLRFAPDDVNRLIFPMAGSAGTGWALKSSFFRKQNGASGWQPQVVGPQGYAQLFGGPLNSLADEVEPVKLQSTPQGKEWLGAEISGQIDAAQLMVNRASTPQQTDLILVDSANGPWLSASKFGGTGALWRVANSRSEGDAKLALEAVAAVIEKLTTQQNNRAKIGLIALEKGPEGGAWTAVKIADWIRQFQNLRALNNEKQLVILKTPAEMRAALKSNEFLTILNPYGEYLPADETENLGDVVAFIGAYVKAGGHWFEVGGYPFFVALRPLRFYSHSVPYPTAFADFMQLETKNGSAAIYGVQPQSLVPWQGAQDKKSIFVPGKLSTGGDENGGYIERAFGTFVGKNQTWTSPVVRFVFGGSPEENLRIYAATNNFTRTLEQKVKPAMLAKMKGAVLVKLEGSASEKTANLDKLPAGSIVHFSDYLKGGFDKEYPDHLPPNPSFGTPQEFKTFLQKCRELGHLSEPYTNPTWWCDHPRGPTFQKYGDAPLLRDLDGKLAYEKYGDNDGWTTSFWHQAVREANQKTVDAFTKEYPVDIQFQDQLGARAWKYDTNAASPTPYAYYEGMISQGLEDSFKTPLGTEDGHDRVINIETQLCGMSWGIVPFENPSEWRRLLRDQYDPSTWELFPMAQILAHDKTAFYFHDLGAFVTNQETLAYALALGFNMSYRISASQLNQDAPREWLKWLDRLQKSVGAAQFGQPLKEFKHTQFSSDLSKGSGIITARYGDNSVWVNLSDESQKVQNFTLAPYGFLASISKPNTMGGVAGMNSRSGNGFVFIHGPKDGGDLWIYAPPETEVSFGYLPDPLTLAPARLNGSVVITFDGEKSQTTKQLKVRTPARPGQNRVSPSADLAGKAPQDWAQKPAIAVLDFGPNFIASWTKIAPQDWKSALDKSRFKELGAEIKILKSVDELFAALQAGPRAYAAIINPYPEIVPTRAPGTWQETLTAIQNFVNNGGQWWETGGYSFHVEAAWQNGAWQRSNIGPAGAAFLGLSVGSGEIEEAAQQLAVPERAKIWLGTDLTKQIEASSSMVNRGLPRGTSDVGHFTLMSGKDSDFLGAYRLNGWGYLWRVGGFYPNPDVTIPATVNAIDYLYSHPAPIPEGGGIKYLWHAVLQ